MMMQTCTVRKTATIHHSRREFARTCGSTLLSSFMRSTSSSHRGERLTLAIRNNGQDRVDQLLMIERLPEIGGKPGPLKGSLVEILSRYRNERSACPALPRL